MAKNDFIANHKRGLLNSTFGNFFRGGLTGALIFGGIAALAAVATGGLALPVLAAAAPMIAASAFGGGMIFGGLNATGGALRWTGELVGGILGPNRKRPMTYNQYNEPQQAQAQGMGGGLVESLIGLTGAGMGLLTLKNALFGNKGKQEAQAPQQQNPATVEAPAVPEGMTAVSNEQLARMDARMAGLEETIADLRKGMTPVAEAPSVESRTLEEILASREAPVMPLATQGMAEQASRKPLNEYGAPDPATRVEGPPPAGYTPPAAQASVDPRQAIKDSNITPESATNAAREAAARITSAGGTTGPAAGAPKAAPATPAAPASRLEQPAPGRV